MVNGNGGRGGNGRVVTAAQVEAAAQNGSRKVVELRPDSLVTPLAWDRARVLGVSIVDGNGRVAAPLPSSNGDGGRRVTGGAWEPEAPGIDLARLKLESHVRAIARRVLLRTDSGLDRLEWLVAEVMDRLGCG